MPDQIEFLWPSSGTSYGGYVSPLEQAIAAIDNQKWLLAEQLLRPLADAQSDSADIHYLLGIALWQQGNYSAAEPNFLRAHVLTPDFPMPCYYLAGAHRIRKDIEGALTWLDKFLALAPNDGNGWLRQGELLLSLARSVEAVDKLQHALLISPESSEARTLLGHALFNCGQYSESIDMLAPLADSKALKPGSLRLLCRAAEEIMDYPRAIQFASQLVDVSPNKAEDRLILARALFACGHEDEGITTYRNSLELSGDTTKANNRTILPVRVVTTETWELIAARWVALGLPSEMTESGRIRPSLTRHDQALVLAPEWLAITSNRNMLVEQMVHNPKTLRKKSARILALTETRCLLDLPSLTTDIIEACALIGGSTNYYHWLVDHLPRIGLLSKSADLSNLHLLVNDDLAPFQHESLATLGISPDRLIPLPAGAIAKCRVVWVPTMVTRLTAFHPFAANWLRRTFLKKDMKQGTRRRLYVSRVDAGQGRLLNEVELIELLRPLGFETINLEKLSFYDQIATFANADIIIGPHGAGLTNIVFAPQQVKIIELGFPQYSATFFRVMAGQIGQRFKRIEGQAIPTPSSLPHTWNFRIDIKAVMHAIAAAI